MAAVTALRAVQPAPPDPAREQLRAAIANVVAAEAAVDSAREARGRVHRDHLAALAPVEMATAALREAESQGQKRRLAMLLGAEIDGPSLEQLRQAISDAGNAIARIAADQDLLDHEIARREQALSIAVSTRTDAVGEVLAPLGASMLARVHALRTEAITIEAALAALPIAALPHNWRSTRDYEPDPAPAATYRNAVAALAADPDAAIPSP